MILKGTCFLFAFLASIGFADEGFLEPSQLQTLSAISSKPLPVQAQTIESHVTLERVKSSKKNGHHFFDFIDEKGRSVDDVVDLEGLYGKVQCPKKGEKPNLVVSDDAPPATLLHQFIHFYQITKEKRWCELEGRILESDERTERAELYHRFEFEALKVLFGLEDKMTMNFEDKLIILEGLKRENQIMAQLKRQGLESSMLAQVNRDLEAMHSQINYITWQSKTSEDAGTVLQKMEVLTLKSCAEAGNADFEKNLGACLSLRCKDKDSGCPLHAEVGSKPLDKIGLVVSSWVGQELPESCGLSHLKDEMIDSPKSVTSCWRSWYESHETTGDTTLSGLTPKELKSEFHVPLLAIDKQISFQKVKSPQGFIQKAYCYSLFKNTSRPLPIEQFAYASQSVTVAFKELKGYQDWLEEKEGQACAKLVKTFTDTKPARFDSYDRSKSFMLIVNPFAALSGGVQRMKSFEGVDINHQRLHLIFAENKTLRSKIKKEWEKLSLEDKEKFKTQFDHYDFSEEQTLLREYFSYTRQEHPDKLTARF